MDLFHDIPFHYFPTIIVNAKASHEIPQQRRQGIYRKGPCHRLCRCRGRKSWFFCGEWKIHPRNLTYPKDHWSLQRKGLNLYSKGRVLKNSQFWGVRILRVDTKHGHLWKDRHHFQGPSFVGYLAARAFGFFFKTIKKPIELAKSCRWWNVLPTLLGGWAHRTGSRG